jgi:hypothetical protein
MIRPEKLKNAFYALQGVIIRARQRAAENAAPPDLVRLLDDAEGLPRLLAASSDETTAFRANLAEVAEKFECAFVLQRLDDAAPASW